MANTTEYLKATQAAGNELLNNFRAGETTNEDIEVTTVLLLSNITATLIIAGVTSGDEIRENLREEVLKPLQTVIDGAEAIKMHKAGLGKKMLTLLKGYDKMLTSSLRLEYNNQITHSESFLTILKMYHKKHGLEGLFTLDTKAFGDLLKTSAVIGEPLHKKYVQLHDDCPSLDFQHIALESVKADSKNDVVGVRVFTTDKNHPEYKALQLVVTEHEKSLTALQKFTNTKNLLANIGKKVGAKVYNTMEIDPKEPEKTAEVIFNTWIEELKSMAGDIIPQIAENIEKAQEEIVKNASEQIKKLEEGRKNDLKKAKEKAAKEKALKEALVA